MADSYIDYFEIADYGDHFGREAVKLEGASLLLDMAALRALVAERVAQVDAELTKAGIVRSEKRGTGRSVDALVPGAKRLVQQFYSHLNAQDDDVALDVAAFFERGRLGSVAKLGPEQLIAKLDRVLKGFDAPANAALPGAADWRARLVAARDDLKAALAERGGAQAESIRVTAELRAARDAFLTAYNGVAKKLVAGLLAHLGRSDEYRLFFKDLQVPTASPSTSAPEATPTVPATPDPVDA